MLESEETEHLKRVLIARFTNFFIASSFTHSDLVTSINISSQPCFNGGILCVFKMSLFSLQSLFYSIELESK